ncbi:MAG: nucleoside triphosphate pyrophosphohydrolase, partial [Methylocystaceae bacterium]
ARHVGADPEQSLRAANAKFERRFYFIERRLAETGKSPTDSSLDEMEELWREAKATERK